MPQIVFPKMQNEFGVLSGLLNLVGLCVFPDDVLRRGEMVGVFNVFILHSVKYGEQGLFGDLRESASFEEDLARFGREGSVVLPPEVLDLAPEKIRELMKSSATKVAAESLELPEDIERFLINADKPQAFQSDFKIAIHGIVTCILILIKLMQMQKLGSGLRGDASLNKAIELLTDVRSAHAMKSETNIRKAWKKYGRSVHVAIGLMLSYHFVQKTDLVKNENKGKGYIDDLISPPAIGLAIIFAKAFQDWLLDVKISKHASPSSGPKLVKPNHLWLLPPKIQPLQNFKIEKYVEKLPPLEDWELELLRQKRRMQAPKKFKKQ